MYDVFGHHPSTFQGADRLYQATGALVVVPDFFKGEPLPLSAFPPDTEEKKALLAGLREKANPALHIPALLQAAEELKAKGFESLGSFGLCWGGLLTALTSTEGSKFKAAGTAHPG